MAMKPHEHLSAREAFSSVLQGSIENSVSNQTLQFGIGHPTLETGLSLRSALSQLGYRVCFFTSDRQELLEFVRTLEPNLVFLHFDLLSPDLLKPESVVPLILIIDGGGPMLPSSPQTHGVNILGVVDTPVSQSKLIPLVPLVLRRFQELQLLRDEFGRLENSLHEKGRNQP